MKHYNFSLCLLTFLDWGNVIRLVDYIESEKLSFDNLFIFADKIPLEVGILTALQAYQQKSQLNKNKSVKIINRNEHGGRIGTKDYIHYISLPLEAGLVVLEDDLFATKEFFDQCEHFFAHRSSAATPIFVGYSNTPQSDNPYYETFNSMHLWGFAIENHRLQGAIRFHDKVRKYGSAEKMAIVKEVLNHSYPCLMFEKHKHQLIEKILPNFLAESKESVDLYFLFHFLRNHQKIVKPTKSFVRPAREIQFVPDCPDVVESDMLAAIQNFRP